MKLLILTDGIFPFVVGGMQRHSSYLVKHMVQRGHKVCLVHTVSSSAKVPTHEETAAALGLDAHAFESKALRFPAPANYPGHYLRESYAFSLSVYNAMKGRFNEFDFIYAKGFSAWHLLAQKARGERLPKIGVKFHGYEMFQPPASFKSRFEHWLLRGPVKWNTLHADFVFSYGGKITGILEKLGVARPRIIEVPTGIDGSWLRAQADEAHRPVRFVFLGRFERRKGVQELNEVLETWDGPAMHFDFIGPIPQGKRVAREWIAYHGQQTETEAIQSIMDKADVLVVPSHSEGMPNVIMEAMARGMAVVATDVGGVAVQVDSVAGMLIKPADKQALRNALVTIAQLPTEELSVMKQAALDRVKREFLWTKIAERIEQEIAAKV